MTTWSLIARWARSVATVGWPWSSSCCRSILRPLTPPLALAWSTASLTPSQAQLPRAAFRPLILPFRSTSIRAVELLSLGMVVVRPRLSRVEDGETGDHVLRVDELPVDDLEHLPPEPILFQPEPELVGVTEGVDRPDLHSNLPWKMSLMFQ